MSTLRFNTWQDTGGTEAATASEVSAYSFTEPALQLVTTATLSSVNTVQIDNCFSSVYKSYRVLLGATADKNCTLYIYGRSGGTTDTTGPYRFGRYYVGAGGSVTAGSNNYTNYGAGWVGDGSTIPYFGVVDIHNPYEAVNTNFTVITSGRTLAVSGTVVETSTQYDSLVFIADSSGLLTGTVRIYGYKDS